MNILIWWGAQKKPLVMHSFFTVPIFQTFSILSIYPYNWQSQILTISTKLCQCLILTRWASLIPFSHQQVPAKVNNIKVKTCKSCKYLNDAENLFVIVIVLALFLLLETLDPVVLAEPFNGQSQEIRYNGRIRHWCFDMKTNLYSSTQLNSLSDAVNHYSPKMSTTTMNKTVAEPKLCLRLFVWHKCLPQNTDHPSTSLGSPHWPVPLLKTFLRGHVARRGPPAQD